MTVRGKRTRLRPGGTRGPGWETLLPGLHRYRDTCNVYLLKQGDEGLAVDFGAGAWMDSLPEIGIRSLRHVLLTHVHRDQCAGLSAREEWPFEIHVPTQDLRYCRSDTLSGFWKAYQAGGCPPNYAAPIRPITAARGDVGEAQDLVWEGIRVCAIPTPGHTRGALSYVVTWGGRSVAFCGDAVHAGGTLPQPFHLEWDHWTAEGSLAAWYGLERLGYQRIDLLCPAHGPAIAKDPRGCIREARKRLMAFVRAKGSVCEGERDRWAALEPMSCGARLVLPGLYLFGGNSYLLAGDDGEGLVVDPTLPDVDRVAALMEAAGVRRITATTASHYHRDHSDGLAWLRDRQGAEVWLHPWVAEPLRDRDQGDFPWLPAGSIVPDRILPEEGSFRWNRYRFGIWPFPGQTRWHCAFQTRVGDQQVLFSGDNYQPPSRWNGTGGFCAYNGSRFRDGFARSAGVVLRAAPDLICNGHGCVYRFHPGHYRRILRWSEQAEAAVRDLCPSKAWLEDYDCHALALTPFRSSVRPGESVRLGFQARNHRRVPVQARVRLSMPPGWESGPASRGGKIPPAGLRRWGFGVSVPGDAKPGRWVLAAEVEWDGAALGERAVALMDVAG